MSISQRVRGIIKAMTALGIIQKYIAFFEKRGHKRIPNSPLIPENDPTTLFTSSGMQPLVSYLLGEEHPQGKRLVDVQNCFRAQDIEEVGDNRHTTFFRMLGNWSLGDYFKKEQLPWFFEFLTKELKLNPKKLYVSIFSGYKEIAQDQESEDIWQELFSSVGIDSKERIFTYPDNWWSRSGLPEKMPAGEPGGPDSEVFYEFDIEHNPKYGEKCHPSCECGKFLEIGNSVFMEFIKNADRSFGHLPQKNVDFGGGLERLLAAAENNPDVFQDNLFLPITKTIEQLTNHSYKEYSRQIRIIVDHFTSAVFITSAGITPSNKEQGYILRRLIRRGLDSFYKLKGQDISGVLELITSQYKDTDPILADKFEKIKYTILEEEQVYRKTLEKAKQFIWKKYEIQGDEIMGETVEISANDAFLLYSTHGLSPTQIKSLGFNFDEQKFADKMKEHQELSRQGASQKFRGGLADHHEKTIMGHTATHLLHQALRYILGNNVHQTGSNITTERVRFDFNFDRKLTDEEIKKVENIVNDKIKEELPVHFEILPLEKAKKLGAIGLFDEKYQDKVKVYFVGNYSREFCGGPHVENTKVLKHFAIIKQENIGHGQRRIYAKVGEENF